MMLQISGRKICSFPYYLDKYFGTHHKIHKSVTALGFSLTKIVSIQITFA